MHETHEDPVKDEGAEHRVPLRWREPIAALVKVMAEDPGALSTISTPFVPVDEALIEHIRSNVEEYGGRLVPLSAAVWERSVSSWQGDHWDVLVDLSMEDEPVSDLTLHLEVEESGNGWLFRVHLVYVP